MADNDGQSQDQTSGTGSTGTATANDPSATQGDGSTDGSAPASSAPIEISDEHAAQLPAGTTVHQTADGQLKAIVPGASGEEESTVHHIYSSLEHGIEALIEKVKAFFAGTDADATGS